MKYVAKRVTRAAWRLAGRPNGNAHCRWPWPARLTRPKATAPRELSQNRAVPANDPDWVVVTTWNDWGEQTMVEPSQQYGDLYLDLTRDSISRWKRGGPRPTACP